MCLKSRVSRIAYFCSLNAALLDSSSSLLHFNTPLRFVTKCGQNYLAHKLIIPRIYNKNWQICVQLPTHADNMALPAFTRRCCDRYLLLTHSSKPAVAGLLLWVHAGTDRRTVRWTDTVPFHGSCTAYYAGSANCLTRVFIIIIIILYYVIYGSTQAHRHKQLTIKIHQNYI